MASIPMAGYSSPQIRRAMLGQRKGTAPETQTVKPLEIPSFKAEKSPVVSPTPATAPKSAPALSSPPEQNKNNFLIPPVSKPAFTPSSVGAVSETKEMTNSSSLADTLKPFFSPPIGRKQLFMKFRSISQGQQQPTAIHADSLIGNDEVINHNFPRSDIAVGSVSGNWFRSD